MSPCSGEEGPLVGGVALVAAAAKAINYQIEAVQDSLNEPSRECHGSIAKERPTNGMTCTAPE